MTFAIEMETLFGTDAAMGVCVVTDDGVELTLAEYDAMAANKGDAAMPGCQSVFPDGTSALCCTDYARQISAALPGRTQIFGFYNEKNPTARVAREEWHPSGHDFAVVDGRYVVDPWLRLVAGEPGPIVFDMQAEAAVVAELYGPLEYWEPVPFY